MSSTYKLVAILLVLFIYGTARSEKPEADLVMNGMKLADFKDFEKNWHLVTVRFRKDTQEMRWTFANDAAWKTLSSGSIEYQNGAMFAKIGAVTHEDTQFPSSAVPSGARRFQFMVRDSKKFNDTGGWGYSLFDVDGKIFPDPIKETTMACYACHQIVENRGQVFSQPFTFLSDSKVRIETTFFSNQKGFRTIEFGWAEISTLPKTLRELLPPKHTRIRLVRDSLLQKNLFQGTLDEIRPRLELEAYKHDSPAALIAADGKRFSVVTPAEEKTCKKNRSFKAITTLSSPKTGEIATIAYCNP